MPKIVDADQRIEDIKPLAKRFLIRADFKDVYPNEWNMIYGMSLQDKIFSHTKTLSKLTKFEAMRHAAALEKEELFLEQPRLVAKMARDRYLLEVLDIIEAKPGLQSPSNLAK